MDDSDFTFGSKGKLNLTDFDGSKIKPAREADTWETLVLSAVAHLLFIGGLLVVAFLWWVTGRKDG